MLTIWYVFDLLLLVQDSAVRCCIGFAAGWYSIKLLDHIFHWFCVAKRAIKFAEEIAAHGLRVDMNPTMSFAEGDEVATYMERQRYLKRADRDLRDEACVALCRRV